MAVAMLNDTSKCTACKGCQAACKQWNELPAETTKNTGSYQNPPDLSFSTFTHIRFKETNIGGQTRWLFQKHQCFHCTDAACVEACPTNALKNNSMGFVSLEPELCSGCGYCVRFCPFGIPKQDGSELTGKGVVSKCHFCQDRTTSGLTPSCAKTCPPGAISFGDREKMIALGKQRVEIAKNKGYTNASLYGESELGGLGIMYVLLDRPATYGLPEVPTFNSGLIGAWDGVKPLLYLAAGGMMAGSFVHMMINKVEDPALIAEEEEKK